MYRKIGKNCVGGVPNPLKHQNKIPLSWIDAWSEYSSKIWCRTEQSELNHPKKSNNAMNKLRLINTLWYKVCALEKFSHLYDQCRSWNLEVVND
jgi:hypothetical protein